MAVQLSFHMPPRAPHATCSTSPIRPTPTSWCPCAGLRLRPGSTLWRPGPSSGGPEQSCATCTAAYELIARAGLTHERPALRHRQRAGRQPGGGRHRGGRGCRRRSARCCTSGRTSRSPQPRVLVVAPLSGHFATLLRGTVRTLLPEHDVYITDWHNARDVRHRSTAASASTTTSSTSSSLLEKHRPRRARGRGVPALRRRRWPRPP